MHQSGNRGAAQPKEAQALIHPIDKSIGMLYISRIFLPTNAPKPFDKALQQIGIPEKGA